MMIKKPACYPATATDRPIEEKISFVHAFLYVVSVAGDGMMQERKIMVVISFPIQVYALEDFLTVSSWKRRN